jgi:hypothetical protein
VAPPLVGSELHISIAVHPVSYLLPEVIFGPWQVPRRSPTQETLTRRRDHEGEETAQRATLLAQEMPIDEFM